MLSGYIKTSANGRSGGDAIGGSSGGNGATGDATALGAVSGDAPVNYEAVGWLEASCPV